MHEAILMHANVDESTEVGDIRHDAGQFHHRYEVFWRMNTRIKLERFSLTTRVAAGLFEFLHDIGERRQAYGLRHIFINVHLLPLCRIFDKVHDGASTVLGHLLYDRITLRVHGRGIKRVLGSRDTKETGALLEGRRTETWHFLQLRTRCERTILLAIVNDILCQYRSQTGDISQQVLRSGIDIHTYGIDTELHCLIETMFEFCLVYIVLILSHTDTLRINLHQLGQRIHQSAPDRHGTSHRDILVGELLACHF